MKILFTLTSILVSFILGSAVALAQITITSADISALNAVGSVMSINADSTTTSLNIGSPGATTWDFSSLKSHTKIDYTSVTPAATPYLSDFPTSDAVFSFQATIEGESAYGWLYQTQTTDSELTNGMVLQMTVEGENAVIKSVNSPAQLDVTIPFTYNSQWNSNYTSAHTTYYNGVPMFSSSENNIESAVVDAYGTMTMPGGTVLNALRIKRDERYTSGSDYDRTISYSFVAKNGTRVEVTAKDTTHTSSGVIQIEDVAWFIKGTAVGIESQNQVKTSFSLSQNYPNPFNSTTRIRYTIPEYSSVQLKVYDFLGREVASLVNEDKSPGIYEVEFDGSQLPRGLYFYKIQAGTYTETRKMTFSR